MYFYSENTVSICRSVDLWFLCCRNSVFLRKSPVAPPPPPPATSHYFLRKLVIQRIRQRKKTRAYLSCPYSTEVVLALFVCRHCPRPCNPCLWHDILGPNGARSLCRTTGNDTDGTIAHSALFALSKQNVGDDRGNKNMAEGPEHNRHRKSGISRHFSGRRRRVDDCVLERRSLSQIGGGGIPDLCRYVPQVLSYHTACGLVPVLDSFEIWGHLC